MHRTSSPYGSRVFRPAVHYLRNTAAAAASQARALDEELGLSRALGAENSHGLQTDVVLEDDDNDEKHLDSSGTALLGDGGLVVHGGSNAFHVGVLFICICGSQLGLFLANSSILASESRTSVYPTILTWLQAVMVHMLLLAAASLTRNLSPQLTSHGLAAIVAPSSTYTAGNRPARYTRRRDQQSPLQDARDWLTHRSGGIAGGGLLEFDRRTARRMLPVALLSVLQAQLCNLSLSNTTPAIYILFRSAVVPLSFLASRYLLTQAPWHTTTTLASSLLAAASLLLLALNLALPMPATPHLYVGITYSILSSLPAALFPIMQYRDHTQLLADLDPLDYTPGPAAESSTTTTFEASRAYWRVLHYTSLWSVLLPLPMVLLSGELPTLFHAVRQEVGGVESSGTSSPWLAVLLPASGVLAVALFAPLLLLSRLSGPEAAAFASSVPAAALGLVALYGLWGLGLVGVVALVVCLGASVWFGVVVGRARDLRGGKRRRG